MRRVTTRLENNFVNPHSTDSPSMHRVILLQEKEKQMSNSNQSEPKYTLRVADQRGDGKLIADLLLEYPENKAQRDDFPPVLFTEQLVLFDEKQVLVGTCQLIVQRAGLLRENLMVHNLCARSWAAEEILRLCAVAIACKWAFMKVSCQLVNVSATHRSLMIDDGYDCLSARNNRVLSIMSRRNFFPAIKKAQMRQIAGEIPQFEWVGEDPLKALQSFRPAKAADEMDSKSPGAVVLKALKELTGPQSSK